MERGSVFVRPAVMVGGAVFCCEPNDPFVFKLHKHDHITELFFVEQGGGRFTIDGVAYDAVPGTLLFYQRSIWHEERSTIHPFVGMYIAIEGIQLQGLPPLFLLPPEYPPVIQLGDRAAAFAQSFRECIEEFNRGEPEARVIGSHLLGVMLARIVRLIRYPEPLSPPKPSQSVVLRARQYIEERYEEPITLASLAKLAYVSPYYLSHLFKAEMGISPIQYLIQCRVEVAKHYLATTEYTISRIASLVGYGSENTFYSLFKRTTGTTPLQYRKLGREERRE